MKRRVKVLAPLEEDMKVNLQMLDPRSPNFFTKVHDTGDTEPHKKLCERSGDAQRASWDAVPGTMQARVDAHRMSQAKFSSLPGVLQSSPQKSKAYHGQETSAETRSKSCYPAVPAALFTSKWSAQNSTSEDLGYAGSTQSESSAASVIELESDGHQYSPNKTGRPTAQRQAHGQTRSHSDSDAVIDVHEAARRSIEQSRLQQHLRRPSNPVAIPQAKSGRKLFGF